MAVEELVADDFQHLEEEAASIAVNTAAVHAKLAKVEINILLLTTTIREQRAAIDAAKIAIEAFGRDARATTGGREAAEGSASVSKPDEPAIAPSIRNAGYLRITRSQSLKRKVPEDEDPAVSRRASRRRAAPPPGHQPHAVPPPKGGVVRTSSRRKLVSAK
ncbi:hypothetical protein C8R46DRAFT_1308361 [Mycena filopes]|nr:hypothetical protein C8R46DRAFT_1308361 [Mycena filopes]